MIKPFKQMLFLALIVSFNAVSSSIVPAAPSLAAKSYVLMDYDSGKVIVEHNADLPLPPASLTKMMTSYVVSAEIAEGNINLSDKVLISNKKVHAPI